jgi:shikimate dehydrogenase
MKISGRTRLLGLLGRGIEHTLSPALHNHTLTALGEDLVYLPFEIVEHDLAEMILLFPRIGGVGLNVTTPYKEIAGRLVRPADAEVQLTGSVNTIVFRDGHPLGYSTDGSGFRNWMRSRGIHPGPSGIAILGFGAAGRSIAYQLGQDVPLTIVSRSPKEIEALLQSWYVKGWPGLPVRVLSWADPPPAHTLLTIGCLPVEAARSGPIATWLAGCDPTGTVVDLNYGPGRTPLRDQARDRGLDAVDGLGLLVHQAALSLSLWLGRSVPVGLLQAGLTSGTD